MPGRGPHDIGYWVDWAIGIKQVGLANAYTVPTLNYNPVLLYVLSIYGYILPTVQSINENINYLKIPVLIFDFAPLILLMWWLNKNGRNFFSVFFILLNIAYLYNTMFWGQVDAIHTALIFFAFYFAIEEKMALSMVLFLIAINTKTQSIFFLPVIGLLWLPQLKNNGKQLAKGLAWVVVIQLLIILPFIIGGTVKSVWNNYTGVVDYNNALSMFADNFWYLVLWDNDKVPFYASDQQVWNGLTLKAWSLLIFFAAATIVLLPLFIKALVKVIQATRFSFTNIEVIFLTAGLVTLVFFYFPTQMHERYAHPAMLFIGVYCILSKRWLVFGILSYAYLMNLEAVDQCWEIKNHGTFIFDPRLIAILYALVIIMGTYRLYKDYGFKADWVFLKNSFSKKALA